MNAALNRRDFFRVLGAGVLVLACWEDVEAQESGRRRPRQELPQQIDAWLHVGENGTITVFTGKAEMGQNIRTSLAQAVAEELRVPVASLKLVMADTQLTPYDMGTFGSRTTPTMSPVLRKMAASAREALTELAAQQWNAQPADLKAADGKVTNTKTGRSAGYAELAKGQKLVRAAAAEPALTAPAGWQVSGKSVPKVDGRDFVTGRHKYASDIARPGLLFGKVLRPPAYQARLLSLDSREAEAVPGAKVVHDGDFVGAVASRPDLAVKAVAALQASWSASPAQIGNAQLFDYLKKNAKPGQAITHGSLTAGLAAAARKLERTYLVNYIAHSPLEPRAAVAEWQDGKLTVWTGTQRPFAVQQELAEAFQVPIEQVRVIVPDTGSGYGGKHTGECAVEAARLAKAAGAAVKRVWTREEEFSWAYFRPAGVIEVRSGIQADGAITAWEFHNYNSGPAAIGTMYDIPNQHVEFHPVNSPLRQGSYRGLAATANHFARESAMDELAAEAGMDPLEFRLKNLKNPRLRAVFEAAAQRFGWGKTKPAKGTGYGIAGGFEKGGYVATCAEVSVDSAGKVALKRVVEAFDCGPAVNPEHLRNQIEGAIVQAIGGALFEAIEFSDGRILNGAFSKYRLPRFEDTPVIEAVIMDRREEAIAGAGETPIVGLAPAVAGAIFQATGVRLRSLPLAPRGVKSSLVPPGRS